jgi:hypothetical protein
VVCTDRYAELTGRVRVADGKVWDRQPQFRGPIYAEDGKPGKTNGSQVPGVTRSSRAGGCSGLRPDSMGLTEDTRSDGVRRCAGCSTDDEPYCCTEAHVE